MTATTDLIKLRWDLHQHPELSEEEKGTAERIHRFLSAHEPDDLLTEIGGYGIAAVFRGPAPGPNVVVRCEMDALPIAEDPEPSQPNQAGCSLVEGVSHACGHDGHMAAVAGLAPLLQKQRPALGSVILLFQPAEECGKGALAVLADPRFLQLQPTFVCSAHNVPGRPIGEILVRNGVFSCASKGLMLELEGESSHASQPHRGSSPALAAAQLIQVLSSVPQQFTALDEQAQVTVIYARIGEVAFGTSPRLATVMATLRSDSEDCMERLSERCIHLVAGLASTWDLQSRAYWTEVFPATLNHRQANHIVEEAAKELGLQCNTALHAFPWSEDFGHFTAQWPGAMFGVGAGEQCPALHSHQYQFADDLLKPTTAILANIIDKVLTGRAEASNRSPYSIH